MFARAAYELAQRQLEIDREILADRSLLALRKQKRLTQSPLGFFRGSAPLFYELLSREPALALPDGDVGYVVGDMHIENVGAYRTDSDSVTFDLNDFDDAARAPLWVDRLRLAVSVLLAGRSFDATAPECLTLVSDLLTAYDDALTGAVLPELPKPVVALIDAAGRRTRKQLLDMRAPPSGGQRRFTRGDRYSDLRQEELAAVSALVEQYRRALGDRAPQHAARWRLVDAAYRVAGTGSLGRRRIALLVADADGTERIFELKEAAPSSCERLVGPSGVEPSLRVVSAARALVASPPRQLAALGATPLGSLIGRKLCPEEDKLDLARLSVGPKLAGVARVVGALLGQAHRRDASPAALSPVGDHEDLIDRAVSIAGVMEAVYLAYARLLSLAELPRS